MALKHVASSRYVRVLRMLAMFLKGLTDFFTLAIIETREEARSKGSCHNLVSQINGHNWASPALEVLNCVIFDTSTILLDNVHSHTDQYLIWCQT